MDKYSWGQSLQEVKVYVHVPSGTKPRLIVCQMKNNHLKVGLKGQPPVIDVSLLVLFIWCFYHWSVLFKFSVVSCFHLQGEFFDSVNCFWTIGIELWNYMLSKCCFNVLWMLNFLSFLQPFSWPSKTRENGGTTRWRVSWRLIQIQRCVHLWKNWW